MGGLLVPYDFSRLLRNSVLSIVAIKRMAILLLSRLEASLSWNVRCLHWYFPDKLYAVLLHQKMYVRKAKRSVSVIKKNRMGYSAKPHRRITRFEVPERISYINKIRRKYKRTAAFRYNRYLFYLCNQRKKGRKKVRSATRTFPKKYTMQDILINYLNIKIAHDFCICQVFYVPLELIFIWYIFWATPIRPTS